MPAPGRVVGVHHVRACIIGQTGAGLDVNEDAQVLDTQGNIIPGLYAAGETVGVAMGQRYSGGGMGICNAIVYGRIAGQKAAASLCVTVLADTQSFIREIGPCRACSYRASS